MNDATYKRIRAALCEFSTVGDLDAYAACVALVVLDARAKKERSAA